MSLFKNLFNANKSEKEAPKSLPWKSLTSASQLDEISELSKTKSVVVFKHSTRCGISRMVLKQFERDFDLEDGNLELYYLDLLSYRTLSDEIAARFQVLHQSPQLLVIKNGVCVAHGSHYEILEMSLQ
ncbi:MAG: bacillithiol system redox-active protein YtxJ [Flavobacteriaceae bacterium]